MELGPILSRELLTTSRRPRFYWTRFGIGAVILLFLIISLAEETGRIRTATQGNRVALLAFGIISGIAMASVLMLTPGLVSGVVVEERQRKTLDYLLTSPLSSLEIIAGKLASRMLHLLTFACLGVPIQAILLLYGGIDPVLIPIAFGEILAASWFLGTMCIWVSVTTRVPKDAYGRAAGLMALWMGLPAFFKYMVPMIPVALTYPWSELRAWALDINEWIAPCNPIVGIVETMRAFMGNNVPGAIEAYAWTIGEQLLFGAFFLLMAVIRLRPSYAKGDVSTTKLPWHKRQTSLIRRKPPMTDNPVFWKEAYCRSVPVPAQAVGWIITAAGVGLLGWGLWEYGFNAYRETWEYGFGQGSDTGRESFNIFLRLCTTILSFVWTVGLSNQIASAITSEIERDSWTSLISTPMMGKEVVWGKILGTLWILRGMPIAIGILWLLGLTSGSIHPLGVLLAFLILTAMTFFSATLAMFASLTQKTTSRAQSLASAIIFGMYLGVWFCCGIFGNAMFGRTTAFALGASQPAVFAFVQATWRQWSQFSWASAGELQGFSTWAWVFWIAHFVVGGFFCIRFEADFNRLADRPRRPLFGDSRRDDASEVQSQPSKEPTDLDFAEQAKSQPDRIDS